jgi:hypothetical protein
LEFSWLQEQTPATACIKNRHTLIGTYSFSSI